MSQGAKYGYRSELTITVYNWRQTGHPLSILANVIVWEPSTGAEDCPVTTETRRGDSTTKKETLTTMTTTNGVFSSVSSCLASCKRYCCCCTFCRSFSIVQTVICVCISPLRLLRISVQTGCSSLLISCLGRRLRPFFCFGLRHPLRQSLLIRAEHVCTIFDVFCCKTLRKTRQQHPQFSEPSAFADSIIPNAPIN